eukprot:477026_1
MSYRQTSSLLNVNTNNANYQTYHDEMSSIEIHKQSISKSKTKSADASLSNFQSILHHPVVSTASPLQPYQRRNSSQRHKQHNSCKICVGRLLKQCEPGMKWLLRTYYVLLCNSVIICTLLIVSRIFSDGTTASNNLFHSNIFTSDSPPLLLIANIVMMISYSLESFLALRICLAIGCSCFALWGLTSHPMLLDSTMFNTVMMLLNVRHAVILSYAFRHVEFEPNWEQIYVQVFEGFLNRVDFNKLVEISYKRKMKKGEIFKKKDDEVTSLCCLVSGRIKVVRHVDIEPESASPIRPMHSGQRLRKVKSAQPMDDDDNVDRRYGMSSEFDPDLAYFLTDPHFVNLVHKNQFIEAPQWVHAHLKPRARDRFTVSFVAVDDCEYIKWPKE